MCDGLFFGTGCYYSFYPYLKDIAPHFTYFLDLVYATCQRYETITSNAILNMSFVYDLLSWEVRLPVWEYIQIKCPSFRHKDCNAQFSEIFQNIVFGDLNETEKSLFVTNYEFQHHCICGNFLKRSLDTFVRYIMYPSEPYEDFFNSWRFVTLIIHSIFYLLMLVCFFI